jgi:hypothetical protein
MISKEVREFVEEFFFDDQFPGDYKNKREYIKESVKMFDEVLKEEFGISFKDLDSDLQESFLDNLKEEWELYKEEYL